MQYSYIFLPKCKRRQKNNGLQYILSAKLFPYLR